MSSPSHVFRPAGSLRTITLGVSVGLTAVAYLAPLFLARVRHREDATHRAAGRWLRSFGRQVARAANVWDFSLEGAPPPDVRERPYVVVANHQSAADPLLLSHVPWDMRWVVKRELIEVPLLGTLIRLAGDIPIDRGSRVHAVRSLAECERTLKAGLSVMLFPEGTRNPDHVGSFKDGAFRLAIRAQVPVLPIALAGTAGCMASSGPLLGKGKAIARVLEPTPTEGLTLRDTGLLRDRVRRRILDAVRDLTPQTLPAGPTISLRGIPAE